MTSIDSHQHFWRLDRGDYGWLTPALAPIYRDYLPRTWRRSSRSGRGCDHPRAGRGDRRRRRASCSSLRANNAFIAGVVGWVDFDSENAPDTIAALATDPKLVGLRPMIQDIPDTEWMLREKARAGLRSDDRPRPGVRCAGPDAAHLPALLELAARYPDLAMVLDHGAKPPIASGDIAAWKQADHRARALIRPSSANSRASSPKRAAPMPRCSRTRSNTCSTLSARRA